MARGSQHALERPAVQPQQPVRGEGGEPRTLRLDRGADRLQPHEQPLPAIGDAGRIGWHERQRRTAGERLAERRPGSDAERLRSWGRLPHACLPARLRRERRGHAQQLFAVTGGDGQLEAGKEDADDHGTNACSPCDRSHATVPRWKSTALGWRREQ